MIIVKNDGGLLFLYMKKFSVDIAHLYLLLLLHHVVGGGDAANLRYQHFALRFLLLDYRCLWRWHSGSQNFLLLTLDQLLLQHDELLLQHLRRSLILLMFLRPRLSTLLSGGVHLCVVVGEFADALILLLHCGQVVLIALNRVIRILLLDLIW